MNNSAINDGKAEVKRCYSCKARCQPNTVLRRRASKPRNPKRVPETDKVKKTTRAVKKVKKDDKNVEQEPKMNAVEMQQLPDKERSKSPVIEVDSGRFTDTDRTEQEPQPVTKTIKPQEGAYVKAAIERRVRFADDPEMLRLKGTPEKSIDTAKDLDDLNPHAKQMRLCQMIGAFILKSICNEFKKLHEEKNHRVLLDFHTGMNTEFNEVEQFYSVASELAVVHGQNSKKSSKLQLHLKDLVNIDKDSRQMIIGAIMDSIVVQLAKRCQSVEEEIYIINACRKVLNQIRANVEEKMKEKFEKCDFAILIEEFVETLNKSK
ncbi:hypothetical protein ACOME3_010448 [Neoechinorhynchus agilis]